MPSKEFPVEPGWPLVLKELGARAADVLRRAELPDELFARPGQSLATDAYFRLWQAVADEVDDPAFPLRIAQVATRDPCSPPIVAAFCSSHLTAAARRLAHYKRLVAPMRMGVEESDTGEVTISLEWLDRTVVAPPSLVAAELAFLVELPRVATREPVVPLRLEAPSGPDPVRALEDQYGVPVRRADVCAVTWSSQDARRPFLTANDELWAAFEPMLRRRLSELEGAASTSERVRAALLESLPAGSCSVEDVSRRLGLSKRTLQRRLNAEDTSFQELLHRTREELARHYLARTSYSGAEISYLLGYDDPNSFFRAFHAWTGTTTEQLRPPAS